MRRTAHTKPSRLFPGSLTRPHAATARPLRTMMLVGVLGALMPSWAHAQEKSPVPGGKLSIPPPKDGNKTLTVRVQVTHPYIDKVATRVTYDGMDRVFGIEWKTSKASGKLRVPNAAVVDAEFISGILDETNAGVSVPELYTPVTTPRLFPYLIAVRDKWGKQFDEMAHASAKIAAISMLATLRPMTGPLAAGAAGAAKASPGTARTSAGTGKASAGKADKPTLPRATAIKPKAPKAEPAANPAPTVASTATERSYIWSLSIAKRGRLIEKILGSNLVRNFPVIDRWHNGKATSIKSLNLGAKSYQNASRVTAKVRGYIDKVAKFSGQKWANRVIAKSDITGRALELAVPSAGTPAQQTALKQLIEYGRSVGVEVKIIVIP